LRELGCQYGQGYLFSKPVGADGAVQIVAETRACIGQAKDQVAPEIAPAIN
jgi:EAL domain-containing protein (putative c-di-GMP-specific phosphodiesterase class I)